MSEASFGISYRILKLEYVVEIIILNNQSRASIKDIDEKKHIFLSKHLPELLYKLELSNRGRSEIKGSLFFPIINEGDEMSLRDDNGKIKLYEHICPGCSRKRKVPYQNFSKCCLCGWMLVTKEDKARTLAMLENGNDEWKYMDKSSSLAEKFFL